MAESKFNDVPQSIHCATVALIKGVAEKHGVSLVVPNSYLTQVKLIADNEDALYDTSRELMEMLKHNSKIVYKKSYENSEAFLMDLNWTKDNDLSNRLSC